MILDAVRRPLFLQTSLHSKIVFLSLLSCSQYFFILAASIVRSSVFMMMPLLCAPMPLPMPQPMPTARTVEAARQGDMRGGNLLRSDRQVRVGVISAILIVIFILAASIIVAQRGILMMMEGQCRRRHRPRETWHMCQCQRTVSRRL